MVVDMPGISSKIMRRVRGHGRGKWVCTATDFLGLGNRAAVDQALSRLAKSGQLRRVGRGLYDLPRMSRALGRDAPADVRAAVDAIARRDKAHVIPAGIVYANRLGLTNAVPAKLDYLTSGTAHSVKVGNRTIRLRHVDPKRMSDSQPGMFDTLDAASVGHALRWLGKNAVAPDSDSDDGRAPDDHAIHHDGDNHRRPIVDDNITKTLRRRLPDNVRDDLAGIGKRYIPTWALTIVHRATTDGLVAAA